MDIMDRLRGVDNPYMKKCMDEIEKCSTVNDMFKVLNMYYDLDIDLSYLNKQGMLLGLPKLIKKTDLRQRNG